MYDENEQIKELADRIFEYGVEKYIKPMFNNQVGFFRAEVITAANSAGKIEIQRPFDENTLLLNCTESAKDLQAGDQCLCLFFGTLSNAVVFADGKCTQIGSGNGSGGSGATIQQNAGTGVVTIS